MEEIRTYVDIFIKELLAKKRFSATDVTAMLLYDMSKCLGRMEQRFNDLTHEFEKVVKSIEPIAQLAKEMLEKRRR